MPNDKTSSIIPILRSKLDTIFESSATVHPELTNVPVTATAVLEKQTANIERLYEGAGELCTGLRVWYYQADNTTLPTVSATAIEGECDLTTGDGVSTASQDYDFNVFEKEYIKLNSKDCDNFAKFTDDVAFMLGHKMTLMYQAFNDHVITELEANKSTATATNLPDNVTVVGGNYTITGAAFWQGEGAADTLAIFDQLARIKGLPNNYYIISGKALRVPYDIARDHQVNDNERSYYLTFQRRDIYWDEDNLDALVGAEVVYLVDPNAIASYFYSEYPADGEEVKDKNNTLNFSLEFRYFDMYQDDNGSLRTVRFANGGFLEDARIDVRYQRACNSTINKYGKPSLDEIWELDMVAMFDFVPATGDNTGIIRIDKA